NRTATEPKGATLALHELFTRQAERTPEREAVVFGGAKLTYGELDRRSNEVASRLRKVGVGPDVVVGLMVERSLDMVVGLFGILKAGGAYVPLDPSFPPERLAYMVEHSGMPVLVTHRRLDDALSMRPKLVVRLDDADAHAALAKPER